MSEITKEELMAMMDVQVRSATAMENIANSIKQVSEQNKETVKLQTELVKSVTEEREKCTANICAILEKGVKAAKDEATVSKVVIDKIKEDTGWLKVIIGGSTLIILIASVIIQFMTGDIQTRRKLAELENKLLAAEKAHLQMEQK